VLANVPASIAFLRAELARLRGDAARAVSCDQQAMAHLSEEDWLLRSQVAWNLAVADWFRGRLKEAEHALAEVVAERSMTGESYFTLRAACDLGQVQQAQGRLGAALRTYQQGLEMACEADHQLPPAGMAHVALAEVLYERDELAEAYEHAAQGVALGRQLAFTQPLATGLAMLARIRQVQGDTAGALDAIGQAGKVGLSPQLTPLLNPVPAWQARLMLARGEVAAAGHWASGRELGADDEPGYPRERDYLVLARLLLAEQTYDRALRLLERMRAQATAQQRTGSIIELAALQTLALAASGDQTAALASLAEALILAAPEGYIRVFADEGAPMARLLGRIAAAQRRGQAAPGGAIPLDYLDRLALAFQPGGARPVLRTTRPRSAVAAQAEPLSARELDVLGLLAAGKSNQQIADELVVVRDTVKKHVGHILDKLGAANRTQAVARARALGLLR
jgi:ATP/maltotriose-dependent transcriptional regulator MalT